MQFDSEVNRSRATNDDSTTASAASAPSLPNDRSAVLYGNPPPKEDDEALDSEDSQGYNYKERAKLRSLHCAGLQGSDEEEEADSEEEEDDED